MFKHIVVAVDFSPAWPRLQQRMHALHPWGVEQVTLVHVLSSRYPATPEVSHRGHYETRLGEEAERLEAKGLRVDWQVRAGHQAGRRDAGIPGRGHRARILTCSTRRSHP